MVIHRPKLPLGALYLKGLPGLLKQDSSKGIELLSKAVRAKSLTARFNLGMAYYNGDGVEKNVYKASQWLRLAVQQNFPKHSKQLGLLLIDGGDGVPKNTTEGLNLLEAAAKQDHQWAKEYLNKEEKGPNSKNSEKEFNYKKESNFLEKSLNDDEVLNKARKFYTGVGVEQDYDKAYEMFFSLVQGGNPEAARFIGLMNLSGKGVQKKI